MGGAIYSGQANAAAAIIAPVEFTLADIGTVAAAGANQGAATAITNDVTKVTAADGAKGVVLPTAAATNSMKIVWNSVRTASLLLYPGSSDTLNGNTADLPIVVPPGRMVLCVCYDGTDWIVTDYAPGMGTPTTLAAAGVGSDNTDATAMTSDYHFVTASDGTKGIKLPAASVGARVRVYNTVADQSLRVWATTGDDINDGTTSSYILVPGKCVAEFIAEDATTWHCALGLSAGTQTIDGSKNFTGAVTTTRGIASGTANKVGGLASVQTTASTAITANNTETTFDNGVYNMPANTIGLGTVVKIRFQGTVVSSTGSETVTVKLVIGGTTTDVNGTALLTSPAPDATNGDIFAGEFVLIGRAAAGAAAACVGFGWVANGVPGTATALPKFLATTNLATNGALPIKVTCTNSSSGESCRLDVFVVEICG